jgi:hypothetical protein
MPLALSLPDYMCGGMDAHQVRRDDNVRWAAGASLLARETTMRSYSALATQRLGPEQCDYLDIVAPADLVTQRLEPDTTRGEGLGIRLLAPSCRATRNDFLCGAGPQGWPKKFASPNLVQWASRSPAECAAGGRRRPQSWRGAERVGMVWR